MSDEPSEAPEVAALRALAEQRGLRVYSRDFNDVCIAIGRDATMILERDIRMGEETPADVPWELKITYSIPPGRMKADPEELAVQIAAALTNLASVLMGEAAASVLTGDA